MGDGQQQECGAAGGTPDQSGSRSTASRCWREAREEGIGTLSRWSLIGIKVELRSLDWVQRVRVEGQDKVPPPAYDSGSGVTTALKDGGQKRPATHTGKHKSPLDPCPLSPHPALYGRVVAWQPPDGGGWRLPCASRPSEQQPAEQWRRHLLVAPGSTAHVQPASVLGGGEVRKGVGEEQISCLLPLFLHVIVENFKHKQK